MERYRWTCNNEVFFQSFQELSDAQIRLYLGLRLAIDCGAEEPSPENRREIGIDEVGLVADVELLCHRGFIRRTEI